VSFGGSISNWIEEVKAGCESAATMLWQRYHQPLMTLAGRRLLASGRGMADEEDVVLDAFHSFLRRCRRGDYPDVRDRHDLWRLLMAITIHKANNQVRDQHRLRRKLRRAAEDESGDVGSDYGLDQLISAAPPVELVALVADSLEKLFLLIPGTISGHNRASVAADSRDMAGGV
jgi:hypothetical protein